MKKKSFILSSLLLLSAGGGFTASGEVLPVAVSSASAQISAPAVASSTKAAVPVINASAPVRALDSVVASSMETEIRSLWRAGEKNEAQKKLNKWMSEDKKSPVPAILAAEFNFEEKRYAKCLSLAGHAIDKFPKAADAYYWRGKAYEAMKKPMEAANEYQAALMAKTAKPDAKESLDRVLAGLGNSSGNQ